MDQEMVNAIREMLKEELEPLKQGQDKLVGKVDNIQNLIEELEPKNANRHLELKKDIKDLRKDLVNVEIITSSNWNEIAKLKQVK